MVFIFFRSCFIISNNIIRIITELKTLNSSLSHLYLFLNYYYCKMYADMIICGIIGTSWYGKEITSVIVNL